MWSRRLRPGVLLLAVAVAFADSSIVVLAVPEVVRELDVGVNAASWVITAYNVAVLAGGLALLAALGRVASRRLAGIGCGAFALASAGCAAAPSFELLLAFRTAQGLAAALVLVGTVPLLGGRAGVRAWILAATIGLAAGPALGGLLTELFSWRSIFAVQAPLVALGLLALRGPGEAAVEEAAGRRPARSWLADATLAALSGALVGALFLVVVLLVNGFGWRPLPAALVATTLPAFAAVADRIARGLPAAAASSGGGLLVAAGLAVLAFLPEPRTGLVVGGLALCGAGLGLAAQPLGHLALGGPSLTHGATWTVVARHAGLVVALVAVTPVLVSSLGALEEDAEAVGGEIVLRSPLPLAEKASLLVELARDADRSEPGVPDVRATLAPYETGDGVAAGLGDRLAARLDELVARAFRAPFLLCAGFGLLAALLALGLGRAGRRVRAPAVAFLAVAAVGAGLGLAVDLRLGALDDPAAGADPCRAPPGPRAGGFDAAVERVALGSLARAACELETSRASLLRDLTGEGSTGPPSDRVESVVRSSVADAIEAERERGTIDEGVARVLRTLVANAPLDWIWEAMRGLDR